MATVEPRFRLETNPRVRLTCWGDFALERIGDSECLTPRGRKSRALLAYLALQGGRPVRRERMTGLLWGDRADPQARASLRQALFELKPLANGDIHALRVDRDQLSLESTALRTDLDELGTAVAVRDYQAVLRLLPHPEERLFADLDDVDEGFDDWLRIERARRVDELLEQLTQAAAAARAENDVAARTLAARLRELDPNAAAPPSFKLQSARSAPAEVPSPSPASRRPFLARAAMIALPLLALAGGAVTLWWQGEPATALGTKPLVLAVVPFEPQPGVPAFVASGLWDDLRTAIARNPDLRLLGRTTSEAMAGMKLTAVEWRRRTGADYLVSGTLRSRGPELLVSVELTRSADGLNLWQGSFRAPADRQGDIAQAIEGQLRSRLAPGGGQRAEQITTSPGVRTLYNEARTLLASRRYEEHVRARHLLRDAVASDPHYAPAWAALAKASFFVNKGVVDDAALRAEGHHASRRALALAPNLAEAHAVAGLLEGENGTAALAHLRNAVRLDPSNVDAWNWLGNTLNARGQPEAALSAYDTAVRLDPLFWPALMNAAQTAGDIGRLKHFDELLGRAERAGAGSDILASLRAFRALARNDLSAAAQALSAGGLDDQGRSRPAAVMPWVLTLQQLDLFEPLHKLVDCPPWYPGLIRGTAEPPMIVDGRKVAPVEFWMSFYYSHAAARSLFNRGRTKQLVALYREGFGNADRFIAETRRVQQLADLSPILSMALQAEGQTMEARYVLAAAERDLAPAKGLVRREAFAQLAEIKAAQGEHGQALALLNRAVDRGWLPGGRTTPLDLRQEPAFIRLRGDPRFEALRGRILATIARERSELGKLPFQLAPQQS